jgi:replicative DNA helicase
MEMKFSRLDELEKRNTELASLIAQAERTGADNIYELKKELYSNKIAMIEIITVEEKRSGITALELKRLVEMRPKVPRYETGVTALDSNLNGGIEVGTFVQLAGESGSGKTHLLLEILSNVSNYSKTVFFNFEMGDVRIIKRLEHLLTRDEQWENLIIDKDSRDLEILSNEIRLHARDGVKFFVIDSKMKIEVSTNQEDHQKFSSITNRLAKLSQQNDIIIFLINQMSEQDIKNKRLAFKGSGDQQYDSDISLFYVKDEAGKRTLICNKNRQDEFTFRFDTYLDANNRTQSEQHRTPVMYQDRSGHFTSKPKITEYKHNDSISMAIL